MIDNDAYPTHSNTDLIGGKRAPIAGPHERHESNVFSVQLAINPLIAASATILQLTTEMRNQISAPHLDEVHRLLCNEIRAFENKAHGLGYRSQAILAARYLLCALTDEIILTQPWGKNSPWQEQSLLQTFQHETWGGERFFLIIERSAEDPSLFIDVLELGYLCLSLGFRGKYKHDNQLHELGLVIDNLYDLIRHQRGEFSRRLLVQATYPEEPQLTKVRTPPVWLTVLLSGAILAAIFVPYYNHLEKLSAPLNQTLQEMGKAND